MWCDVIFFVVVVRFVLFLFTFASMSCLKNVDWLNDVFNDDDDDVRVWACVIFAIVRVFRANGWQEQRARERGKKTIESRHCCSRTHIIGAGRTYISDRSPSDIVCLHSCIDMKWSVYWQFTIFLSFACNSHHVFNHPLSPFEYCLAFVWAVMYACACVCSAFLSMYT